MKSYQKVVNCIGVCVLVFLLGSGGLLAQNTQGVIEYERVQRWTKIMSRLSFLSQEEKDRAKLTWGSDDEWKEKMRLVFSAQRSKYTYRSQYSGDNEDEGTYSWRKSEYLVVRDFEQERKTELIEMLGKTYLLEDSLKAPKWRILNQIKEVAGYVCMKAEAHDPIKNQKVTAWFAEQLPGEAGPEQYFGLPGVILELDLNEGDVVITATKVVLESPSEDDFKLPKRMKGKKINQQEYDRLLSKHIEDSIKAFRNPYWSLRY